MEEDFEQAVNLGSELLELASALTESPEKLAEYNNVLEMPGIDPALFMLYKAAENEPCHPKSLLQSAFMLGYYVCDSLHQADKLWDAGPSEEPLIDLTGGDMKN